MVLSKGSGVMPRDSLGFVTVVTWVIGRELISSDPSSLVVGMGMYIGVHRQFQSKETTQAEAAGTRRHF